MVTLTPSPLPGGWAWPGEAAAAAWLAQQGLGAGDRVLLGPDRTPAAAIAIAAALRLGLTVELAPCRLAPAALAELARAPRAARVVAAPGHPLALAPGVRPLPATWPPELPPAAAPWRGRLVLHTSGTSGRPRRVRLDAAHIAAALAAHCQALALGPHDGWSSPLPLDHIGGVMTALRSLASGCALRLEPAPSADATGWSGVPTQLFRLLEAGLPPPPRLRMALIGGGPLDAALAARARAAGWPVAESYAMSEMCGTVAIDGALLPGVQARLDEDGRVLLAGPMRCAGYEDESGALIPADAWHRSDDFGCWQEGRLRILGRVSERIVSGGEKIGAPAVEAALRGHPAIADAAVFGLPDPEWGERVAALLVCRQPLAIAELEAWLAERLPRHHRPRAWRSLAALPRSELGKLLRAQLPSLWPQAREAVAGRLLPA